MTDIASAPAIGAPIGAAPGEGNGAPGDGDGDAPAPAAPKTRQCLRCRTPFDSAWSGDRICTHCKRSAGWRQGAPVRSDPGRIGRRPN